MMDRPSVLAVTSEVPWPLNSGGHLRTFHLLRTLARRFDVRLVEDAGFDPVVVGGLARAREFDAGTPVYVKGLTAAQLKAALKLP